MQLFKGSFYACSDEEYGDVTGTAEYGNRTWDFSLRADCIGYSENGTSSRGKSHLPDLSASNPPTPGNLRDSDSCEHLSDPNSQ